MQYARFPMKYVNVTQVPNNNFSHKGSISAWDNAGKDAGIDGAFAPFDCKVVWKDTGSAKTGVLVQNTDFVECADGLIREPNTIKALFWHDNDISDLKIGQTIKQNAIFYQEGTAGHATGNHVHFNVGVGKYDGKYPLVENEFGVWEIKGEIDPTKIFFIDDNHIITKLNGMKFIKHTEHVDTSPVQPKKRYLYLDKSVVSWRVYPLDKPAKIGNELGSLAPKKFGGLTYEIVEDLGSSLYVITTATWGKVKIYAGPETASKIVEK